MTTQTARPDTAAEYEKGRGRSMLIFASVLLGVLGLFNLLDGIAAIAQSSFFVANTRYVIGDLRAWGVAVTILGGLQVLAVQHVGPQPGDMVQDLGGGGRRPFVAHP